MAIQAAASSVGKERGDGTQVGIPGTENYNILQQMTEGQPIVSGQPATGTTSAPIVRTNVYNHSDLTGEKSAFKDMKIGLEPTIQLDQLKRYLDHLNEIRRINEGDDTADAPGYSLNLVRIPVSVLPGYHTRKGHGAEVTVTATPHISGEILPRVFRELAINDLVDELSLTVLKLQEAMSKGLSAEDTNAGVSPDNNGTGGLAAESASNKRAAKAIDIGFDYFQKSQTPPEW